jgi:hypothetical protein
LEQEVLKEKIAYLEELFERLKGISQNVPTDQAVLHEIESASSTTKALQLDINYELFHQRHIDAKDFILKIVRFLVEETNKASIAISTAQIVSGSMSIHSAEAVMGAILAAVRASLVRIQQENLHARLKRNMFPSASVFLTLEADDDSIYFRLVDDACGFHLKKGVNKELEKCLKSIRDTVAKADGSCSFCSFSEYGGKIEIRLPVRHTRTRAKIFRFKSHEIAFASSIVNKTVAVEEGDFKIVADRLYYEFNDDFIPVCTINDAAGLTQVGVASDGLNADHITILSVADFHLALLTAASPADYSIRIQNGENFLKPDSWFKKIASYTDGSHAKVAPYLEGKLLIEFCRGIEKAYENN